MKLKSISAAFAVLLSFSLAKAQVKFNKAYLTTSSTVGTEFGKDFVIGSHSYYLIINNSEGLETGGPVLARLDFSGNIRDMYKYNISDQLTSVGLISDNLQWTLDNNLLISDTWQRLMKVSPSGAIIWSQRVPGVDATSFRVEGMDQTSDGKIALCLYKAGFQSQGRFMVCNNMGQTLFYKSYSSSSSLGTFHDVDATPDGGFLITATKGVFIKVDANGDLVWVKDYASGTNANTYNTIINSDGSSTTVGFMGNDVDMIRLDPNGNLVWLRSYDSDFSMRECDVTATSDGGYLIACSSTNSETLLIKTSGDGTLQWNRYGSEKGVQVMKRVREASDGGYAMIGWGLGPNNFQGGFIKTDPTGNSFCLDQSIPMTYIPSFTPSLGTPNISVSSLSDVMVPVVIDQVNPNIDDREYCPEKLIKPDPIDPTTPVGGSSFVLYPNPSDGPFSIESNWQEDGATRYTLLDLHGRIVWEKTAQGRFHKLSHQVAESGLYFLKAVHGNQVVTQRFVIR